MPSEEKIVEALQYARKYEEDLAAKNAAAAPTKRPHITLVHRNEVRGAVHDTDADGSMAVTEGEATNMKDLWERCAEVHEMEGAPLFGGALGAIVWDGRVLAIVVDDEGLPASASKQEASKDEDGLVKPLKNLALSEHTGPSKTSLKAAQALLGVLGTKRRQRLHVTVGRGMEA
ncbi:hypothetical protein DFP72DRAFT_1065626 [Ephemerocybe angulata]|uniref:Uncharacterized protein n=1 Tax=Ephemerocybe angulata TaxID=980116 RepID=A0A8H6I380_9AGAR|nr:hypothetical protein DFP72DRAFT_1065626 [Tulosesus angulatus]